MRNVEELHDVRELRDYDDAAAAVARLKEIYADGRGLLKAHFDKFVGGARDLPRPTGSDIIPNRLEMAPAARRSNRRQRA